MTFDFGINKIWSDEYTDENCPHSKECSSFKIIVEEEINKAFENCPGYKVKSAVVISFWEGNETTQLRVRSLTYLKRNADLHEIKDNPIFATYNTSFDNEQILTKSEEVMNYIGNETVKILEDATFKGSKAIPQSLATMAESANSQISTFTNDPCKAIGEFICKLCFPCLQEKRNPFGVSCLKNCGSNEQCTIASDDSVGCTCIANYLPLNGICVKEDIVIAVSVGIALANILTLLAAVLKLALKLKKNKDNDSEKEEDDVLAKLLRCLCRRKKEDNVHAESGNCLCWRKKEDKGRSESREDLEKKEVGLQCDILVKEIRELLTITTLAKTESTPVASADAADADQHPTVVVDSPKENGVAIVDDVHVQEDMESDCDNPPSFSVVVAAATIEALASGSNSHLPAVGTQPQPSQSPDNDGVHYSPPSKHDIQSKQKVDEYFFLPMSSSRFLSSQDSRNEYFVRRPKLCLPLTNNYTDISSEFC